MADIFDLAKYILEKTGPISTWKLQKLCYYAQAWSLAWTEKELVPEEFQAWRNGPVCPELFYAHKGAFSISAGKLSRGSSDALTEDQKDTVDAVLREYGSLEPFELRELTHSEDPWKNARGSLPEYSACDAVIPKTAMGEYYGSL